MSPNFVEVIIENGKIKPVDPQELPASGRGWLTILPLESTDDEPSIWIETRADGLPVICTKEKKVITSEMVKQIESSTV